MLGNLDIMKLEVKIIQNNLVKNFVFYFMTNKNLEWGVSKVIIMLTYIWWVIFIGPVSHYWPNGLFLSYNLWQEFGMRVFFWRWCDDFSSSFTRISNSSQINGIRWHVGIPHFAFCWNFKCSTRSFFWRIEILHT